MVTTGFSRVHVARYEASGSSTSYTGCRELARAVGMETDISTTDDNVFYANNRAAETEPAQFASGSATITVDGLDPDEEAFILGIEPVSKTIGGKEYEVVAYGENMNPPYMGIGAVKRQQLNGVVSYRAVIFTKGRFAIPSEAAETQEESTSWQTQELNASLMKDDSASHDWKLIPKTNFASEDEAVEFIRAVLGGVEDA